MNEVWIKFIEQAPWAAALVLIVYIFLRFMKEQEAARAVNAASMAKERRDHELQINNMWAVNIKSLIEKHDEAMTLIARSLEEHEKSSKERYEKMKVTGDLMEAINDLKKQK